MRSSELSSPCPVSRQHGHEANIAARASVSLISLIGLPNSCRGWKDWLRALKLSDCQVRSVSDTALSGHQGFFGHTVMSLYKQYGGSVQPLTSDLAEEGCDSKTAVSKCILLLSLTERAVSVQAAPRSGQDFLQHSASRRLRICARGATAATPCRLSTQASRSLVGVASNHLSLPKRVYDILDKPVFFSKALREAGCNRRSLRF